MFWKKKSKEEVEIKYSCLAPNYFEVINDSDGVNMDELKEEMFEKMKSKVLTSNEIDKISEIFEFDAWKAFHWIEQSIENTPDVKSSIEVKQRLKGFLPTTTEEQQQQILQHLNFTDFYKRETIQTAAKVLGFNVYKSCEWADYTQITRIYPSNNMQITFYKR